MQVPEVWTEAASALLAFLLTYAVHSTILLVAVAGATRFVKAAEWRDVLWKAATVGGIATAALATLSVRLPLVPSAAWTMSGSSVAPGGAARSDVGLVDTMRTGAAAPRSLRAPSAQADTPLSAVGSASGWRSARSGAAVGGGRSGGPSMRDALRAAAQPVSAAAPALVLCWLLIAGIGVARLVRRRGRLFALLADRRPVDTGGPAAAFAAAARAAGLRRRVWLTASAACPLPIAPTSREVCVPERFLTELDIEQQRGALAHEVAHLVRRDPAWVLTLAAVEAIFFFQPLNRLARRRAKEAAEYLCDDAAARAGAGLGLARCLASVAAWLHPSHARALALTSTMAEQRATLVHRVERLLTSGARRRVVHGGRAAGAALVLLLAVATGAPAVTRAHVGNGEAEQPADAPVQRADRGALVAARDTALTAPRPSRQETVVRAPDPAASLRVRWDWALAAAESRQARGFWIAYAFDRPATADQVHLSDSEGVSFPRALSRERPLRRVLGGGPSYERGTIVLLFRFDGRTAASIDRVAHRSTTLDMDFGGLPVFWLGMAEDGQSVPWLEALLEVVAVEALADEIVDGLALHATSSIVLPALAQILETHASEAVRSEAAEGLEYHDVPASLALARATATGDPSAVVRAEAAEAIGGILAPGAAAVLRDLALDSSDPEVRAEAAEAFEEQPADEALPALERIIMSGADTRAESEAVEALAVFGDAALPLLRRTIWEHPASRVRAEAVETLGDIGSDAVLPLLDEVLDRHPDRRVREEALDVLGEMDSPGARRLLRDAARRGGSTRARA
jgi:beta-lactamase regulating signal transducer with metallopeptidase domain